MKKTLIAAFAVLALILPLSLAKAWIHGSSGFSPSCSQSTNFLARTSGLSNTDKTNYDTLICGLETDGVGCSTKLDALWILAAPDSTNMLLNLCSSSYSLTAQGTGTFTAHQGYAGNGTTGYFTTGMTPSTTTFGSTWSSIQLGFYIRTNRTTSQNYVPAGGDSTAAPRFYVLPYQSGNQYQFSHDGDTSVFPGPVNPAGTAQGAWTNVRTVASSSSVNVYRNGSSTPLIAGVNNPNGSSTVSAKAMFISAFNGNGTPANFSTDQIAAVWYGAGVTGAQAAAIQNRVNAYMTAYGTNVY